MINLLIGILLISISLFQCFVSYRYFKHAFQELYLRVPLINGELCSIIPKKSAWFFVKSKDSETYTFWIKKDKYGEYISFPNQDFNLSPKEDNTENGEFKSFKLLRKIDTEISKIKKDKL